MIFGTGYYNAMDAEYDGDLAIRDIAVSAAPMKDQLEQLKSRIFQGASKVELGFWGTGKGSKGQGNPTPGSYDTEEREAMRELAKINKVELSVHTAPSVGTLSGLGQQGFNEKSREDALSEIQRSMEFAADTTRGGAVVVHTGEFPRPMFDKFKEFKEFKDEPKKATFHMVDRVTGDIVKTVKADQEIYLPQHELNKDGSIKYDDEENPVYKHDENNEILIKKMGWEDFEKLANQRGTLPEQEFFKATLQQQEDRARTWERYHGHRFEQYKGIKEKLKEDFEEIQKLPEERRWIAASKKNESYSRIGLKVPMSYEELREQEAKVDKELEEGRREALSYREEQKQIELIKERTVPIADYAVDKTADTIARSGMYAMELTKERKLERPLFIAPENIFPEQYGAHPDELRKMIETSRDKMAADLENTGYSRKEAEEKAREHIKATFDVGHANIWKRYFQKKEGETHEEKDKRFKKWLLGKVEELNEAGIIGHVHVSDNFGWADEHLTPGKGNVPIKEFIEKMKKAGIKSVVAEPSHQDFKSMLGAWSEFGSGIYHLSTPGVTKDKWVDVEHSYFGKTSGPSYIVGEFAPSQDWQLWSQTKME